MFNLLSLAEQDTTLKRSGAYYIGPCPFCGGKDRFNLKVTDDEHIWFCRQCGSGKYHDAADYLMRRENITYPEALTRMGERLPARERITPSEPEIYSEQPCAEWRDRAEQFVCECQDALWSPVGVRALDWLHKRGLTDDTLRKYLIGYNRKDYVENGSLWGGAENRQVMLYGGITLPAITDYPNLSEEGHRETERVEVEYIKIRRPVTGDKERKYVKVTGSKPGVFGHWNLRGAEYIVVTEGEFDCMMMDQEAGDLVGVCTFGSSTDRPSHCRPALKRWNTGTVLIAFDNDEAGVKGADEFSGHFQRGHIISLPEGVKDITDAHLAGLNLGDWLISEIDRLGIELTMPKM
jgi:DNA primase